MSISRSSYQSYVHKFADRIDGSVRQASTLTPFANRLKLAGLRAEEIVSYEHLLALPIQSKDEVLESQRANPPFGGLLSASAAIRRIFQSPGPLYEPQLEGLDPWRWGKALQSIGVGNGDMVLNCFGYHLSPAGLMFDDACAAVGAGVMPGGIGSADMQAQAVHDLPLTAYVGLPSYLKTVIDQYNTSGLSPGRWNIDRAIVSAEPLPESLRRELNKFVPQVIMAYGTAEAGLIGYEDLPGEGLVVPDDILIEICDPVTGDPTIEAEGQVVVTLFRPDYPLIRFGTGDVSEWIEGPDGRPRLAGVLGRVGKAVKVRGMFLHPEQAVRTIGYAPGVEKFRLVVGRLDHRDSLTCEVVVGKDAVQRDVLDDVKTRVRQGLRFKCKVAEVQEIAEPSGTIVDARNWS